MGWLDVSCGSEKTGDFEDDFLVDFDSTKEVEFSAKKEGDL